MVFDAFGGAFIAAFGATTLFLLDSATFALASLLFVGIATSNSTAVNREREMTGESVLRSYLLRSAPVRRQLGGRVLLARRGVRPVDGAHHGPVLGLAWVPAGTPGVRTTTLNRTVFPDDLLGRVVSIKGTASGATLSLGSLAGGVVAELLGTETTMRLAALGFGFTGLYLRSPRTPST